MQINEYTSFLKYFKTYQPLIFLKVHFIYTSSIFWPVNVD